MEQNILLVGLGSIGTRHLKNLLALGYRNISVVTRLGNVEKGFEKCKFYISIGDACSDQKINTAIIATPTSKHICGLLEVLENNIQNIYVEKPISHSLNDIKKIEKKLIHAGANLVVGYDLHFDPGLLLMKEYINTKKIGEVVSFISEVGQYLPDWRPDIDYRKSMSAHKSLGGGVMLDLVHEFDYINWLVGPIKSIGGKNGKISNLDIDTEDVSVNIIETTSGALGSLHLDYLQCEMSRKCKVIGDKGVIVWDYNNSTVQFMSHQDRVWLTHDFGSYKRNDRFMDIMKTFMTSSKDASDDRLVGFHDAIQSIKLVESSKESNITNCMTGL
jgi:predicted dehydrogenase